MENTAPVSRAGAHFNPRAMNIGNALHDGQPQPAARGFVADDAVEAVKDAAAQFGRDAGAVFRLS